MHLSLTRTPTYAFIIATTGGMVRAQAEAEAKRDHILLFLLKTDPAAYRRALEIKN